MKKQTIMLILSLIVLHVSGQNYTLYFDGTDDYVANNTVSTAMAAASVMTLEAWIYPQSFDTQDFVLAFHASPTGYENRLLFGLKNGILVAGYNNGESGDVNANGETTLPLNQWSHIAWTIGVDGTSVVYLNGAIEISGFSTAAWPATDGTFSIGQDYDGAVTTDHFHGFIDEARVWSTVRTQADIQEYMHHELGGSDAGLVAYYNMNQTSGTSLEDNSSNSNTGTLEGGPLWKPSGVFTQAGNALSFDGTDDYVSATLPAYGNTFTQEAMIYVTSGADAAHHAVMGYETGSESVTRPPSIYVYNGATIHYGFGDGTNWYSTNADDVIAPDKWYHIATTFDGTNYRLYVDGVEKLNYTGAAGKTPSAVTTFQIGLIDNYFKGQIDEVRIWNTARTASQIRENMLRSLNGDESGLVALYRLNESSGTTAFDATANGNKGTLTNMTGNEWTASGAFTTWLGGTSNAWGTATNWTDDVPTSTDNIGIYKWNTGDEVNISGTATGNNMVIAPGARPAFSGTLTLGGNLMITGNGQLQQTPTAKLTVGSKLIMDANTNGGIKIE